MKKKIFISYSTDDLRKVKILKNLINSTSQFEPLVIADNRRALEQLSSKVISGITESEFVIPILTEKSIHNQWVNQEIGFSKAMNKEIIPLVHTSVRDSLKGFIHKYLDLPYAFSAKSGSYSDAAISLVGDLISRFPLPAPNQTHQQPAKSRAIEYLEKYPYQRNAKDKMGL